MEFPSFQIALGVQSAKIVVYASFLVINGTLCYLLRKKKQSLLPVSFAFLCGANLGEGIAAALRIRVYAGANLEWLVECFGYISSFFYIASMAWILFFWVGILAVFFTEKEKQTMQYGFAPGAAERVEAWKKATVLTILMVNFMLNLGLILERDNPIVFGAIDSINHAFLGICAFFGVVVAVTVWSKFYTQLKDEESIVRDLITKFNGFVVWCIVYTTMMVIVEGVAILLEMYNIMIARDNEIYQGILFLMDMALEFIYLKYLVQTLVAHALCFTRNWFVSKFSEL